LDRWSNEAITDENALEILIAAKMFGKKELQKAAFEKIKALMPDKKFDDAWMNDLKKMKTILDAKKEFENAKEKFDKTFG
jgi:hypothetical protein